MLQIKPEVAQAIANELSAIASLAPAGVAQLIQAQVARFAAALEPVQATEPLKDVAS